MVLDNGQSVVLAAVSGSTLTGTYTVGATGSAQDSADLTVGSISSASVFDLAGNQQTGTTVPAAPNNLGDTRDIVIDTTPPPQPTIGLESASDTGRSDTDDITSDNTPTLSGTALANRTVEVFDGAISLGTTTANGSGNWTLTAPVLSDGLHVLTAKVTDAAGNTSVASAICRSQWTLLRPRHPLDSTLPQPAIRGSLRPTT